MADVVIDGERVLADLAALRRIGAFKSGVHRPTLSAEHLESMRWLLAALPEAGLTGAIDGIGNVLGGSTATGPKLLAGSHLESQNRAGWLDGALGVVYALEAARVINRNPSFAGRAVEVAAWCDEEGHFASMIGSRSYAGHVSEDEIDGLTNVYDGRSLRSALADAGLAGVRRSIADPGRHIGYIEGHIEQGDVLDSRGLKIGIVTSIVAIWQYRITIEGEQNHAGTTRMAIRRDAGLAAARLCVAIDDCFPKVAGPRSVWTTGGVLLDPGAPSIIPGKAELMFQIRDDDVAVLARMEERLLQLAATADAAGPCRITVETVRKNTPARMDGRFRSALERAAERHKSNAAINMPSGAIHDAQVLAGLGPAGMMFVPSIGGISHHWSENTADADIVLGAQVFCTWAAELLRVN